MAHKKKGSQTVVFEKKPYIIGRGNIGGKKESEGPLAACFDQLLDDDMFGEKSWEKAECKMLQTAMERAIHRAKLKKENIDIMLSGDLINQIMTSSFAARDLHIPFLGLYGACSTMTESLVIGSMLIDGGFAQNIMASASSHFCTAERQFRMPVEHGNQRPTSAQWTATAAGAVVLSEKPFSIPEGMRVVRATDATIGKVIDAGIKDANQMGAAMAPSAVDTLLNHLQDTGRAIDYYDLVLTGDLGFIGKDIMTDLLIDAGLNAEKVYAHYDDCGTMLFSKDQDVHGGGSGCGCSAAVFTGKIMQQMEQGKISRILLMSTGALLSTISSFQGESIPGIAHAIALEVE
ncbi:MAG: stage V sporulation protein AD [Firmicutes bacterium]|nr:stage V sporulation protein AD [Bacillota bacterium]